MPFGYYTLRFLGILCSYFTSRATRNPFCDCLTLLSYLNLVVTGM